MCTTTTVHMENSFSPSPFRSRDFEKKEVSSLRGGDSKKKVSSSPKPFELQILAFEKKVSSSFFRFTPKFHWISTIWGAKPLKHFRGAFGAAEKKVSSSNSKPVILKKRFHLQKPFSSSNLFFFSKFLDLKKRKRFFPY